MSALRQVEQRDPVLQIGQLDQFNMSRVLQIQRLEDASRVKDDQVTGDGMYMKEELNRLLKSGYLPLA